MFWLSLLLFVIAAVTAFGLFGYGGRTLADGGRAGLLRGLAALCGGAACALYGWGLLSVAGAVLSAQDGGTDSAPPQVCRTPGWWERHQKGVETVDHSVRFVPLGFVCGTSDGKSYDTGHVPGYVNPAALGLALGGTGCAVAAGYATELRARRAGALE
ncbi:hypothetical protein ACFVOK_05685 [Streptomyces sp. NPDC057798]|uniref:hypothetical protein n=1 Tax=Streptomyces sp. NPDC057798 TaxID=3346252 RepID=UPI00369E47A7